MTPEGRIQKAVIDYAKKHGVLVKRNHMAPGAERGWPDVEFFFFGAVLLVEFKAPGKKPTTLQQFRIDELRKRGHAVCVVDSIELGKLVIDTALLAAG